MRGFHALKMNKNTASSGISLSVKRLKKQRNIIKAINKLQPAPLQIDWSEIIDFQVACLQNGANGIGIPDLIIAQNARQHHYKIYSLDKHFRLLHDVIQVQLYTI